jgi:hypothetical protein
LRPGDSFHASAGRYGHRVSIRSAPELSNPQVERPQLFVARTRKKYPRPAGGTENLSNSFPDQLSIAQLAKPMFPIWLKPIRSPRRRS